MSIFTRERAEGSPVSSCKNLKCYDNRKLYFIHKLYKRYFHTSQIFSPSQKDRSREQEDVSLLV